MHSERFVEFLLTNRVFRSLGATDARALFRAGRLIETVAGAVLFRQGDAPDGFYLVIEGGFDVAMRGNGDDQVHLAHVGPGETLGEMALVLAAPRTATVTAEVDTVSWTLPGQVFEGLLARGDPIALALLRGMAHDLCQRFRQVADERVALVAQAAGADLPDGLLDSLGWGL